MRAVYGPPSAEQALGALPVVAGFCRKLDIAGIIDRAAPVREIARATHGQVIEALIANRLTSPSPMVHVGAWARQFAVAHVLGLAPDVLNDDRIARALDALAPVLEQVTGSVGAAAISWFGIDVSQIHWDMTSVSLHGACEHPEEGYPQPKFGHPKDRRADLKQIQAGVATAADGAVPVFWQPYHGGAGEVCQVTGAMEAPRKLAGPRRFLHRPRRAADPAMALRPGRHRRRSRHRRLVRAADQPARRRHGLPGPEEIVALLSGCRSARDRLAVLLMARAGLRRGELCGLRRSDIHLLLDSRLLGCQTERAHLHVLRRDNVNGAWAKSRRQRTVPLDFLAVQAFDAYEFERLAVARAQASDFVLVNLFREPVGAPMQPDAIGALITAAGRRAGLTRRVTPHQLRHAFGSSLADAGGTIDEIQELLGHVSMTSSQVYLHVPRRSS